VKSLRIRRVEDAVYWLVYLDTFREKTREMIKLKSRMP
jgi:hypothetical protein